MKKWFENNGFEYNQSQATDRFSKTVVDSKTRKKELFSVARKISGNSIPKFNNEKDRYYYKKNLARLGLETLENNM